MVSFIGAHVEVLTIIAVAASSVALVATTMVAWITIDSL
jgi:hypothetical protein